MTKTPSPATERVLEKVIMLRPRERTWGATASAEVANSGPMISCAPALIAELAASAAPLGVPRVSRARITKSSPAIWNSASCAASSMSRPSAASGPDRGTKRPMRN